MKFLTILLLVCLSGCEAHPLRGKRSYPWHNMRDLENDESEFLPLEPTKYFDDEIWKDLFNQDEASTITTEAPSVETEAPTSETNAPEETTEQPTTETEAPTTETNAPEETTEPPKIKSNAVSGYWVFLKAHWSENVRGKLIAGEEVQIVYDKARLPYIDKRYGQRAWNIFAEYKFNDEHTVHQKMLDGPEKIKDLEIMTTNIFLPVGTSKLTIWFKYSGYYQTKWDSDYGRNYVESVTTTATKV
ncbi:uncharacterized protein LOC124439229 isoform X3 [Xenia sp. Carnegie-2017]|uniref:uncharacterized protein LOC124439229 isoform X3 n=1 Tax=Xenia sp. Carnegie-2017 TaxID=2897299 RepID=UPI001F033FA4|nr:uncharacterized protein LOC124439229 isoform X3 [Xenia sp. Carnegie-2017]